MEGRFSSDDGENRRKCDPDPDDDDDLSSAMDILEELSEFVSGPLGVPHKEDHDSDSEEAPDDDELPDPAVPVFIQLEEVGMTKTKTIYVYRNEEQLNEAIATKLPIAGMVEATTNPATRKTAFEFQIVFRKPVKQFARRRATFDDANGTDFQGMWCAEMQVDATENSPATKQFSDIQSSAKLAAIAIPLWYILGEDHPHANKFYVMTNWWKERMTDGAYDLPRLSAQLYSESTPEEDLLAMAAGADNDNTGNMSPEGVRGIV